MMMFLKSTTGISRDYKHHSKLDRRANAAIVIIKDRVRRTQLLLHPAFNSLIKLTSASPRWPPLAVVRNDRLTAPP